jgi:hypothetical protein
VAALATLLACAVVACGGGEDDDEIGAPPSTAQAAPVTSAAETATTSTANVVSIAVRGDSVEGPALHRVNVNQRVTLRVTSDVADEVHVHGFNLTAPVGPDQPAELTFVADIHGIFEVELERSARRILTIEVQT